MIVTSDIEVSGLTGISLKRGQIWAYGKRGAFNKGEFQDNSEAAQRVEIAVVRSAV